jgi:hypothetical protein
VSAHGSSMQRGAVLPALYIDVGTLPV